MWSYAIHDTRTGAHLLEVQPSACSWTRRLTGSGTGSVDFNLLDSDTAIPRATIRELLKPTARTVVVKWGTHVAYAGLVTDTSYERDTGVVTANFMELRTLFAKRMTGGVNQYGATWNFSYSGRSASGAARAILVRSMAPSSEWNLPIDLPANGTGILSRQVDFYETMTIADLLQEVEDQASVTVDFRPYLTSGSLRWEVRVVGEAQTFGVTDLPISPAESRATGLTVKLNGQKQVTGVLALGNGTGEDMVTAYAPMGGSGATEIPVRDEKRESKDLKTVAQLQQFAAAEYEKWSRVREQLSFRARLSDGLTPVMLEPGRLLRMDVRNDPWLPDGVREQRVIALAGDMGLGVTPEVDDVG